MAKSKASKRTLYTNLMAGIAKHLAKTKTITLKGKTVSLAKLSSMLQESIDADADTDAKHVAYLEAAQVSRDAEAAVRPTVVIFTDYLTSTMSAGVLADFGLVTKERAVPTAETKAKAVKKRAATREARHTMGKNQKKKIVGVVTDDPAAAAAATTNGSKPAGVAPAAS